MSMVIIIIMLKKILKQRVIFKILINKYENHQNITALQKGQSVDQRIASDIISSICWERVACKSKETNIMI